VEWGSVVPSGSIIGVAADMDNGTLSFGVDGVWHEGAAFSNVVVRAGLVPVVTLGHGCDMRLEYVFACWGFLSPRELLL
jgi:hypothetical protein